MNKKPLNRKNYGSIPHLLKSKLGPGDHHISPGQDKIATKIAIPTKKGLKRRVIVQEKLDGSNVGIVKLNGELIPITRAGYLAETSPFEMHHEFVKWVNKSKVQKIFKHILKEGERVVGEWMIQAHGLIYSLPHEPFVALDIMSNSERLCYNDFIERINGLITTPYVISIGDSVDSNSLLDIESKHGCIGKPEGFVYRVECETYKNSGTFEVEFLCKYVRHDFEPGIYLSNPIVYNEYKEQF